MNRREFLRHAAVFASCSTLPLVPTPNENPQIAFTFDDPTTDGSANLTWRQLNDRILSSLANHKIKAALFVCGKRVESPDGRQLIATWDKQGHLIGNHSYSHFYFDNVALNAFEQDATRNEPLITDYTNFTRLYRFPFLKEGNTQEKRDGMRSYLEQHDYRVGRATIDASDWAISARLEKRAEANHTANLSPYRDYFLQHIWERAQFYDSLAQRVLSRPVRHTVVLHHNALNALYLDDLIGMFLEKGWKPVDASFAYADPVYDRQPNILPAGESLIWALAKETGRFESELRYPGEDDVYENPRMDSLKL